MKKIVLSLFVAFGAVLGAGCGGPEADCDRICNQGVEDGCRPSGTNCSQVCATAQDDYDLLADTVYNTSCQDEFELLYQCKLDANVCASGACSSEAVELGLCVVADCGLTLSCLETAGEVTAAGGRIASW